jgi:hypothetical protein
MYELGMMSKIVVAKLLLMLLCASLCSVRTDAQEWSWHRETVDAAASFTSVAVDHEGNVHVSYINGGVKYAFRPAGLTKWFTMAVDGSGNGFTSITVDSANNPYICYTGYEMLKYAHWDGKSWSVQQIAPNSGQIGYSCGIGVAPDGTVHIIWYQLTLAGQGEYYHLKHAVLKDGMWQARTVDFDGETGKWNSLRIDALGVPHISYSAYRNGEQKYASWNGEGWTVTTVESRMLSKTGADHPGEANSLLIGGDGGVMVTFMDENSLRLARRKGGSWSIEKVDTISNDSWFDYKSSLVLDHMGGIHICYQDAQRVKHAYSDGKRWQIRVITDAGPPARYPAMAIDRQDTLYISYQDPADGSLKVAVGIRNTNPHIPASTAAKK